MANKPSAAKAAILAMKEDGLNVDLFIESLRYYHSLNAEIGIEVKQPVKKAVPTAVKIAVVNKPAASKTMRLNISIVINPDGTVSSPDSEWDFD